MITTTAWSPEGGSVPVYSEGAGPGVVVVPGSAGTADTYRRLSRVLAAAGVTVHRYDRHPQPKPYRLEGDVDLLEAVLEHTGSRRVLGHSYGGLIVLHAGLRLPLERIAVYDAGISIEGSIPDGVVAPFADAVQRNDLPLAAAVLSREHRLLGRLSELPMATQLGTARALSYIPMVRAWLERLPSVAPELAAVVECDGPGDRYRPITADLLLAYGTRSPAFFGQAVRAVAAARPETSVLELPRARHDAIAVARAAHVAPFARFLAA